MKYEYVELLDKEHKGMIMRMDREYQFIYKKGIGWVESGLFLRYSWPESNLYDLYKEISEKQAMKKIAILEEKIDSSVLSQKKASS